LALEKTLLSTNSYKLWKDLSGKFTTGPFGSAFNVDNYEKNGKYRYVRGKDVKEFFLLENDNVYVPEKDYKRLQKYSLKEGDILISVVGTLGNVSIVDSSVTPAVYSCKSTSFRSDKINTYYLLAYLNSKYGGKLLERQARGALQTGLNIDDLKLLPIYITTDDKQERIASLVFNAKTNLDSSKSLYSQAENMLLDELGLTDHESKEDLSCVIKLSDIKDARRMDAEFYQPKYERLVEILKSNNPKSLGELVTMKKGFEPGGDAYKDEGKLFIRVSSVTKLDLIDKDQKYLSEELYRKLKKDYEPKKGEILLTKDATPGTAYVLKEDLSGIMSGGILKLRLKAAVEPEYISLCINSKVGMMQVERDAGGSIIAHWKPEQIRKMIIPILPKATQLKIADLVQRSHEARKKAKELLDEAKRKVEEMIEKGG
jgi:restriction endonuclease S subunit